MGWRDWQNKRLIVPEARPQDTWRVAGNDVYSCIPVPGYEKDPAIAEAVRSFDPGVIPAWRIQLWLPPGESRVLRVVHHGFLRYYPYPRHLRMRFRVELPADWVGPEPNFMDVFFADDRKTNFVGPPAYMPWDWSVYRYCRANWILLTVEKYKRRVEAHRQKLAEERKKAQEELDYVRANFEKTALPMLEKLTPEDWAEYEQLRQTRGRSRRRVSVGIHRPDESPGSPPGLILPSGSPPAR